ncbi:hypothetical protein UA08_09425 [Talaromyces atroroseus]|uniref:N-acetyltransferase domain-containing protein n=1 Tax=Talaromyces atroroseus TaxID=1441469 RepID=A0A225APF1_TALAT|nr:hypothetical protein UA08_09425 [Talaromyces atroroseus]OKL55297.1 hypothetical protein UA08_09425 [Talaromyces atroroseus]
MTSNKPDRRSPYNVTWQLEEQVRYFEKSNPQKMATQTYERFNSEEVTDSMLTAAARLFSENYGIWGVDTTGSASSASSAKPGERVKLGKKRLRDQYLPSGADCSYVRVVVNGELAGNLFSCRWTWKDLSICWITQLVVHRDYRERGLAVGLLNQLRQDDDDFYGIMSSHPAACLAAAKVFSNGINAVNLDTIREFAEPIMRTSPIDYVRDAPLAGRAFDAEDKSGLGSAVHTQFFVDHGEPLQALAWVREVMDWPLGDLLDGYEFLLVLPGRRRRRSRSRSTESSVRNKTF